MQIAPDTQSISRINEYPGKNRDGRVRPRRELAKTYDRGYLWSRGLSVRHRYVLKVMFRSAKKIRVV